MKQNEYAEQLNTLHEDMLALQESTRRLRKVTDQLKDGIKEAQKPTDPKKQSFLKNRQLRRVA